MSRTALGVATLRAAHQLFDGEPKILVDEPVLKLIGQPAIDQMRLHQHELQTAGARALRSHVLLRSRYAEDRLAEAFQRGVHQYVILGAGVDTFAYRQPEWASSLRIVEVDHPASQKAKRDKLAETGIAIPSNVTFAPVDFEKTTLRHALEDYGIDVGAPVFFSWLGVTMYLTEGAVDAVFQTVAHLKPSSEIVFTFARSHSAEHDAKPEDGPTLAERAAAVGEPWLTYFEPQTLDAKLHAFGFSTVHFLTPTEARELYFTNRDDDLPVPKRTSIGTAIV